MPSLKSLLWMAAVSAATVVGLQHVQARQQH